MQAAQEGAPPSELAAVLEALVAAAQGDRAAALAWAMLAEHADAMPPAAALQAARAFLLAVPQAADVRQQTADLYRKIYADHPELDLLLGVSGLLGSQSPRRAIQTLDTCLAIREGAYLANRFDGQVLRAKGFNQVMGEYELIRGPGAVIRIDPKNLADEFELVDEHDFRVLCQHRTEELGKLLQDDPSAVLIGICITHGGQTDSVSLKDMLVPRHIAVDQWSDWWSKARTAIRRCPNLSIEGRNPVTVSYHPGGLTLEQELAAPAAGAKTPVEKLAVLQQYCREAKDRKLAINADFTGPILQALAHQAETFKDKRPADSFAAGLALQAAANLGLQAPQATYPAPSDVLAGCENPAAAAAGLADTPLWSAALEELARHPDAAALLAALLELAPAACLDDVAGRLEAIGQTDAVARAASAAFADPIRRLDLFVWLWKGPSRPPSNIPSKIELLARMLKTMLELEHDWSVPHSLRKSVNQKLRSAISASDYASYKAALAAMDEPVAGTIKRLVERAGGLSDSVRGNMMDRLKESFFGLFVKARVEPWLDENTIWTTQAAMDKRLAELKDLTEIRMLENARAIGAAAAHGDLSENSEWKFALEERDMLRARAAKLQDELSKARGIHPEGIATDSVGIGSLVVLRRSRDSQELRLTFLGPWDSDVTRNIYSYQTPLAQDLMGMSVGETLFMKWEGQEEECVIEKILPGLKK